MSTAMLLVAATTAAVAGILLTTPVRRQASGRTAVRPARARTYLLGAPAVVVAALVVGLDGRHLGLLVVAAVAGIGVARGVERSRQEKRAQQRRLQVVDYCESLVGELRAGQPVTLAVDRSVEAWPEAHVVAAAATLGASVPGAMRRLAELPGASAVHRLAGAWEISASTGSGLVLAVEQVLATARAEEATSRLVRAELASARATARLVTGLPVVVLLAAQGIGARPWQFLLDTAAGVCCLGAGVVLSLLGLAWIDRIATASLGTDG